jgi:hypothetical protein
LTFQQGLKIECVPYPIFQTTTPNIHPQTPVQQVGYSQLGSPKITQYSVEPIPNPNITNPNLNRILNQHCTNAKLANSHVVNDLTKEHQTGQNKTVPRCETIASSWCNNPTQNPIQNSNWSITAPNSVSNSETSGSRFTAADNCSDLRKALLKNHNDTPSTSERQHNTTRWVNQWAEQIKSKLTSSGTSDVCIPANNTDSNLVNADSEEAIKYRIDLLREEVIKDRASKGLKFPGKGKRKQKTVVLEKTKEKRFTVSANDIHTEFFTEQFKKDIVNITPSKSSDWNQLDQTFPSEIEVESSVYENIDQSLYENMTICSQ